VVLVGHQQRRDGLWRAPPNSHARGVARLIFVDALALLNGEALPDIVKRPTAVNTELTSGPSRQDMEARMFSDLEPAMRQWASIVARLTPSPP